jgi:hypothetical protein
MHGKTTIKIGIVSPRTPLQKISIISTLIVFSHLRCHFFRVLGHNSLCFSNFFVNYSRITHFNLRNFITVTTFVKNINQTSLITHIPLPSCFVTMFIITHSLAPFQKVFFIFLFVDSYFSFTCTCTSLQYNGLADTTAKGAL